MVAAARANTRLYISAQLTNCCLSHGGRSQDWFVQIQCENCSEQSDAHRPVVINGENQVNLDKGDRSSTNMRKKCRSCSKIMSVDYIDVVDNQYGPEDSFEEKLFASFDTKGCKIVKIFPETKLTIKYSGSEEFVPVDIEDGSHWNVTEDSNLNCIVSDLIFIVK
ncbi:MAG: hypothetical protein MHMPM18_001324 [Marteilia pararefringens]